MNDLVVKVENLSKKFGQLTAVDNISFSIKEGEIVGLLGPNGAGKTTTIHMLLGLITPTSGEIEMFAKDFKKHREEILGHMNFSSTYTHPPWHLTIWENLYVTALLYSVENARKRVNEVIARMKLEEYKNTTVIQLSSGWISRLNLARTLINHPTLILLDEPTAFLDPEVADSVRKEILKYRKANNATILWTSHNMAEVEEVCDRVIFLHKGKIIATDTPDGLARTIKTSRVSLMILDGQKRLKNILSNNNWKASFTERFVTVEVQEAKIPLFLDLLSKAGIDYSEISIEKPTLEDYFISIARGK